jgi:tripartite-type tricarboxylate transporter receptor subunit TctC
MNRTGSGSALARSAGLRRGSWQATVIFSALLYAGTATAQAAPAEPSAAAQAWPNHQVRVVNPLAAGSASDVVARMLAQKLTTHFGQAFVVDNKPGASAIIGTDIVARAAPDGYTLLVGGTTTHAGNPSLFKKLPYDAVRDFTPVAYINGTPYCMVVPESLPVKTVQEFIAYGRANPGKLSYGTGNASGTIGAELFKSATGVEMTQINYKGPPLAVTDLIAGRLSVMFVDTSVAGPLMHSGKIRGLAIAAAHRAASFPDLPTLAESGVPGVELTVWNAMWAPAGTPSAIVQKLNHEINVILKMPDIVKGFNDMGLTVENGPGPAPEDLGKYVNTQIAFWARVVKEANIPQQ